MGWRWLGRLIRNPIKFIAQSIAGTAGNEITKTMNQINQGGGVHHDVKFHADELVSTLNQLRDEGLNHQVNVTIDTGELVPALKYSSDQLLDGCTTIAQAVINSTTLVRDAWMNITNQTSTLAWTALAVAAVFTCVYTIDRIITWYPLIQAAITRVRGWWRTCRVGANASRRRSNPWPYILLAIVVLVLLFLHITDELDEMNSVILRQQRSIDSLLDDQRKILLEMDSLRAGRWNVILNRGELTQANAIAYDWTNNEQGYIHVPIVVPKQARQVLVYVWLMSGFDATLAPRTVTLGMVNDGTQYMSVSQDPRTQTVNSENIWLPLPRSSEPSSSSQDTSQYTMFVQTYGPPFLPNENRGIWLLGWK